MINKTTTTTTFATIFVATLALSFSAESRGEQQIDPAIMDRLTEYLDTDEDGVIERLAQEADAIELHGDIKYLMGDTYAGAWFSAKEGKLHVATTSLKNARLAKQHGASASVVERSYSDLQQLRNSLMEVVDSNRMWGTDVRTVSVDVVANAISVRHAPDRLQAVTATLNQRMSSLEAIRFEEAHEQATLSSDVRGADPYQNIINSFICSIGFTSTKGYFTAGHCGEVGNLVNGSNGQSQGAFVLSTWPDTDLGLVQTNSNWTKLPIINGYNDGIINVPAFWGGHIEGLINTTVCRYGHATEAQCGSILDRDVTEVFGGTYTLHGLIKTDACQIGGDSGGPLISSSNKQAQGTLVGGYGMPCPQPSLGSFFEPIAKHMVELEDEMLTPHGANAPTNNMMCESPGYESFFCNAAVSSQGITTGQWTVDGVNNGNGVTIFRNCNAGQLVFVELSVSNPYGLTKSSTSFVCNGGSPQ